MRKLKLSGVTGIFAFVFILAGAFFAVPEAVEAAEGDVEINEANFPDEVFRGYIKEKFDKNGDDVLSEEEITTVTEIDVTSAITFMPEENDIRTLSGIEVFKKLERLSCSGNWIDSLDLKDNSELIFLDCSSNQLESLDVTDNKKLTLISCSLNHLESLNVTNNTNLEILLCTGNLLNTLDISKNPKLTLLNCGGNQLSTLDVRKNVELEELECFGNKLKGINLENNIALKKLGCGDNLLDFLDIRNNIKLETLLCYGNNLTIIDVSKNVALKKIDCRNNKITSLNLYNNENIEEIDCYGCKCEVKVSSSNKVDLSTLPANFDVNKTSNWTGGTIKGNILTFDDNEVTYTYDFGRGFNGVFTLVAIEGGPEIEEPKPDNPSPSNPQPSTQTPAQQNPSIPTTTEKVSAGATVTDVKSKSVYKVAGNATSGYIVTYVRPTSKKAKSVTIPATVTVNGVSCKVTSIANNAFKGQKKLKKVTIGANVTTIGKKAFSGCKNLTKIVVKSKKLKKVGAKAFANINPKAKIKVPKNKKKAYKKLFKKNTGVKSSML